MKKLLVHGDLVSLKRDTQAWLSCSNDGSARGFRSRKWIMLRNNDRGIVLTVNQNREVRLDLNNGHVDWCVSLLMSSGELCYATFSGLENHNDEEMTNV